MSKTVFISYTHSDEELKDELLRHLTPLRREGLIGIWHDRMLAPGEHLDQAIQAQLSQADLIIMLISAGFLSSDYCTEKEMVRALQRAKSGEAKALTVILRPCQWQNLPIEGVGRLGEFLALPRDGKPVITYSDRDTAWDQITAAVRSVLSEKASVTGAPAIPPSMPEQSDADVAKQAEWHGSWSFEHASLSGTSERTYVIDNPRIYGRITPDQRGIYRRHDALNAMQRHNMYGPANTRAGDFGASKNGAICYGVYNIGEKRIALSAYEWLSNSGEVRFFSLQIAGHLDRYKALTSWAEFLGKASKFLIDSGASGPFRVELGCTKTNKLHLTNTGMFGLTESMSHAAMTWTLTNFELIPILQEADAEFADVYGLPSDTHIATELAKQSLYR